jgi:hypothetical protein
MATNTFSSLRELCFRPRPKASYTWTLPMLGSPSFPYINGTYAISGWIRDAGGVPQQRVVELIVFPGGIRIARTVSDASNAGNNYFFNGLLQPSSGESYTLAVHNEDVSTAARIKDNRVPV